MSEADLYVSSLAAAPPSMPGTSWWEDAPLIVKIPLYTLAFLFTVKLVSKIIRRRSKSILERKSYGSALDPTRYQRMRKNLKMIKCPELSPEQLAAGRERRRRDLEREGVPLNLEDIPIPANHPFAVRKELSAEEEKAIEERLSPLQPGQRRKRRLSAADEELMRRAQAMDASPVTHGVQDR